MDVVCREEESSNLSRDLAVYIRLGSVGLVVVLALLSIDAYRMGVRRKNEVFAAPSLPASYNLRPNRGVPTVSSLEHPYRVTHHTDKRGPTMANGQTSFGYLLPTREVVMAPGDPDFASMFHLAETAEGSGFDSVWCGDSVLARPRLEALGTLAAIAGRTKRVKLGTAVFLPALRNPVVLANEVANLDIMSQGRVILGVGIASKTPAVEKEFNACGVSFRHRVSIFEECVTVMRKLWTESEVTFDGRHFKLDGISLGLKPVQKGGIPLWMAASAEKPQCRMLKMGDGWFPNSTSPEKFTEGWQQIEALAKKSGDDAGRLHKALYTTLNINEDKAQADKEMREFIEGYYNMPFETMSRTQSVFTGNVQDTVAWLKGFVAAGVETIVVRFGGPDQAGQLELCGTEIMPQV